MEEGLRGVKGRGGVKAGLRSEGKGEGGKGEVKKWNVRSEREGRGGVKEREWEEVRGGVEGE